jgi:tetratricopeptide (TPR) repeat protein
MSTLGLNMIVGPKEAHLLKRCLTSFNVKENFDEIVIVNTSMDEEVNTIAREFTDKVFFFQWETEEYPFGNFGGAREYARQKSSTDKIWWLDTDDVCQDLYKEKLVESIKLIKDEKYKDVMIWMIPYIIIVNDNGNSDAFFKRERVFDRVNIQWKRTVHELMFPGIEIVKPATINNMFVTHLPNKPTYSSALRNVKMLELEYKNDPDDIQTKYFLGRDYMFVGEVKKGIDLLESILSDLSTGYEMLYAIAIDLAWFYAYGCLNPHPPIDKFKQDNLTKVEGYCRLAISFTFDYAEPYVLLGDVYYYKEEIESATKMYQIAIKKKLGTGKFQTQPMYLEIPSERLSRLFQIKGMLGLALHFNECAKKANSICKEYSDNKKFLVNKLVEEVKNEQC